MEAIEDQRNQSGGNQLKITNQKIVYSLLLLEDLSVYRVGKTILYRQFAPILVISLPPLRNF